jgi:hypothetical protein
VRGEAFVPVPNRVMITLYLTYLVQRYRPVKGGALLSALLGGAYSSTATTVVLAKPQKEAATRRPEISAGIIAATAVMYPRLAAVIAFFSPPIAAVLLPGLGFLFTVAAAISWWEWRKIQPSYADDLAIQPANPLQLTTALIFAVVFLVVSLATAWVQSVFGRAGIFTLAALVGASDIDPFVLSLAQGGAPGMSLSAVAAAVLIAASANNIAKAAYAIGFGGLAATERPGNPTQRIRAARLRRSGSLPRVSAGGTIRSSRPRPLVQRPGRGWGTPFPLERVTGLDIGRGSQPFVLKRALSTLTGECAWSPPWRNRASLF